jgi:DNA adenine methylase
MQLIKYPGGKARLLRNLPSSLTAPRAGITHVVDPFLGSGACAHFYSAVHGLPTKGSDISASLMRAHEWARNTRASAVVVELARLPEGPDEELYYEIRARYNEERNPAYFLWLTYACFNGVVRFNKKGNFNSPVGRWAKPPELRSRIEEKVAVFRQLWRMEGSSLGCHSWEAAEVTEQSLLISDPPYAGTFSSYAGNSFEAAERERLADYLQAAKLKGAQVLGFDSPSTEQLYRLRGLHTQIISEAQTVGGKRGARPTLLIT